MQKLRPSKVLLSMSIFLNKPPLYCSFCRKAESSGEGQQSRNVLFIRCSRCELKNYCSPTCEAQDDGSHAGFCLHIERMRKHYKTYPSHPLGVLSHQMGNLMFHVGYRTMDTFEHEAHIFQEALYYFLEAYSKYKESGRPVHNLEDQILLIYVALGHDVIAFHEIFRCLSLHALSESPHNNNNNNNNNNNSNQGSESFEICEHQDLLSLLPDAPWRTSHLAILLLLKLRLLCRLKAMENQFHVFAGTHAGIHLEQVQSVVMTILMGGSDAILDQERQIRAIRDRLPVGLIEVIFHSRPMTHTDAPALFHVLVPTECWQILQDCFRMTPDFETLTRELLL